MVSKGQLKARLFSPILDPSSDKRIKQLSRFMDSILSALDEFVETEAPKFDYKKLKSKEFNIEEVLREAGIDKESKMLETWYSQENFEGLRREKFKCDANPDSGAVADLIRLLIAVDRVDLAISFLEKLPDPKPLFYCNVCQYQTEGIARIPFDDLKYYMTIHLWLLVDTSSPEARKFIYCRFPRFVSNDLRYRYASHVKFLRKAYMPHLPANLHREPLVDPGFFIRSIPDLKGLLRFLWRCFYQATLLHRRYYKSENSWRELLYSYFTIFISDLPNEEPQFKYIYSAKYI